MASGKSSHDLVCLKAHSSVSLGLISTRSNEAGGRAMSGRNVDEVRMVDERVEALNRLACGHVLERAIDSGLLTRNRLRQYRRVIHAYEAAAVAAMSHLPADQKAPAAPDEDSQSPAPRDIPELR
jgi:hypothetical protein